MFYSVSRLKPAQGVSGLGLWLQGFALVLHFKKWDTRCWRLRASLTHQEGKATCTCILLKCSSSSLLWDHYFCMLATALGRQKQLGGQGKRTSRSLPGTLWLQPRCNRSRAAARARLAAHFGNISKLGFLLSFSLHCVKLLNHPRDLKATDLPQYFRQTSTAVFTKPLHLSEGFVCVCVLSVFLSLLGIHHPIQRPPHVSKLSVPLATSC